MLALSRHSMLLLPILFGATLALSAGPGGKANVLIPMDKIEGVVKVKGVATPAEAFTVQLAETRNNPVEGDGAVSIQFTHTVVKGPGDYVRMEVSIPRGALDLTKGAAYLHFKAPKLPVGGSYYLLMESPGANAVLPLSNFRETLNGFRAIPLSRGLLETLKGTAARIDPSTLTRIFLGMANIPVSDGGVVEIDAVTDRPLAPLLFAEVASAAPTIEPAAPSKPESPLRIVTNTPYVHLKDYRAYEDWETKGVRSYPAPAGAPMAQGVQAVFRAGGKSYDIPLYSAPVYAGEACHGSIDSTVEGEVEIQVDGELPAAVKVRPLSKGIAAMVKGKSIRFKIPGPGKYSIELDERLERAVHLFVNPLEKNPPLPDTPGVVYFGPGYHDQVGMINLTNGQTLYVAGGAYLYRARVQVKDADRVTVRGRGIVDTAGRWNNYQKDPLTTHCLGALNTRHLTVEGLTFLDAETFCTVYRRSSDLRIRNVKIIAKDGNTDQNDLVGCQRVHVSDVFYRGYDDGIVVKVAIEARDLHSCEILAENSVIWTDKAHALTVGTEVLNNVYHVVFTNIDVLHVREPRDNSRALAIHVGDNGTVHDVIFDDIRIENLSPPFANNGIDLIQVEVKPNVYSKTGLPGHVRNILFRNIQLGSAPFFPRTDLKGFDADHTVEGITFENIRILGTNVMDLNGLQVMTNQWVRGITVRNKAP
ncbi:MAG: hypothetical protein J0L75_05930 [Spirochaetes bacterium]|nr:hypothetical protein [Spirochaetota bacterium]